MSFWKAARVKNKKSSVNALITAFAVIAMCMAAAMPVLASEMPDGIVVYDNREKNLKIREITFSNDFTSMSVLVENLLTKEDFRIEHELDTADTQNEHIEITATDGMDNVSEMVKVKNPFFLPAEEPETAGGVLNVTGSGGEDDVKNDSESGSVIENVPVTAESEIAANGSTAEGDSFNTGGWASVVDNVSANSKEFFIVRSDTGNEFYVVIDREGGKDNIYFLNAVTEWDLLGLTQQYEVPNNLNPDSELSAVSETGGDGSDVAANGQENGETQNTPSPAEPSDETEPPAENPIQGSTGIIGIIILVLFAGAVGAYFYFFKFKRKNKNVAADEYLPDNYGDEDGEDEDENDGGTDDEDEEYEDDEDNQREAAEPENSSAPGTPSVPDNPSSPESPSAPDKPHAPDKPPDSEWNGDSPPTQSHDDSDNPDKDIGDSGDGDSFTDDDDYAYEDDYGGDIDEDDVLDGDGGDEDDTV